MISEKPIRDGAEEVEAFRSTIVEVANKLLDEWYEQKSCSLNSKNSFTAEYNGFGEDSDGLYIIGRENGAKGANDEVGFDYFYRKPADGAGNEYVYGNYGWMNEPELEDEIRYLRQLFEQAVERDFLDDKSLHRFESAVDIFNSTMKLAREQYNLSDIEELLYEHDIDSLRRVLATDDEEGRVIWQMLFSKDESDNVIENPIEVPVVSEQDQLMFIRTERYYHEDGNSKHYAYGAVIGYDDTPERFFVHRIESDKNLRDSSFNWTVKDVKSKMGFHSNLHEHDVENLPYGRPIRVQGDLVVIRREYQSIKENEIERRFQRKIADILTEWNGSLSHISEHDKLRAKSHVSSNASGKRTGVNVYINGTDKLKSLQDDLGIEEKTVRTEQSKQDWDRLTSSRRKDIIEYILTQQRFKQACEDLGTTREQVRSEVVQDTEYALNNVRNQSNEVIGNHVVILGGASRNTGMSSGDTRAAYIVPERADGFVIHDEHDDKRLALGPGGYEFRFLDGFEDEWWMNN